MEGGQKEFTPSVSFGPSTPHAGAERLNFHDCLKDTFVFLGSGPVFLSPQEAQFCFLSAMAAFQSAGPGREAPDSEPGFVFHV